MDDKIMDISVAQRKLNAIKRELTMLQKEGWTTEICNASHSIFLSSGEIIIKAVPTKKISITSI